MCVIDWCQRPSADHAEYLKGNMNGWKQPEGFEFAPTLGMACPWHVVALCALVLEGDEKLRSAMLHGAISAWARETNYRGGT